MDNALSQRHRLSGKMGSTLEESDIHSLADRGKLRLIPPRRKTKQNNGETLGLCGASGANLTVGIGNDPGTQNAHRSFSQQPPTPRQWSSRWRRPIDHESVSVCLSVIVERVTTLKAFRSVGDYPKDDRGNYLSVQPIYGGFDSSCKMVLIVEGSDSLGEPSVISPWIGVDETCKESPGSMFS